MTVQANILATRLQELTAGEEPARYVVAFSGGIDSTALLHALASIRNTLPQRILAVHIDHGLHEESGAWALHCRKFAAGLGVDFVARRVAVSLRGGAGLEAAARHARYTALREISAPGDCILTGHHSADQAETLLLNLVRGSGFAGLAGIGVRQRFGRGYLLRPLLQVSGDDIDAYARQYQLAWCTDPSNADTQFDRNFLRREAMPVLRSRWPAVENSLTRSAEIARESSELLNDLADIDLASHPAADRLLVSELSDLSGARQANLIRRAISLCRFPPPPFNRLAQVRSELLTARPDASPRVAWPGAELRRYRDCLYVLNDKAIRPCVRALVVKPGSAPVALGEGLGSLTLEFGCAPTIDAAIAESGLLVRFRRGGEQIRLRDRPVLHKLKKLLQEEGIVPWMRDKLPLLYRDDDLVAVADIWVAADYVAQEGYGVRWDGAPGIR